MQFKKHSLLLFLVPFLIVALNVSAHASEDLTTSEPVNLNPFLSYTKDQGYDINKMVSGYYDSVFTKNSTNKPITFENSLTPSWIKVEIDTNLSLLKSNYYIKVVSGFIQKLELYYLDQNDVLKHYLSGAGYEMKEKQLASINTMFHIKHISNNKLYLKLIPDGMTYVFSLQAYKNNQFIYNDESNLLNLGIKYGIFLFVFILNLFYFLTTRNTIFLYYSLYILISFVMLSAYDGTFEIFFNRPISTLVILYSIPLFFSYLPFLGFKFLELRISEHKRLFKWIIGLMVITMIVNVNGTIFTNHRAFIFKYGSILFFISLILLSICIIKGIKKNKLVGVGFFSGILVLIIGTAFSILHSYGIMEVPFGRELGSISVILETIILSLTLAFRFSKIELTSEKRKKDLLVLASAHNEMKVKAFSSQMNPHFLFNSLNSIQRMYVEGNTDLANDYLSDFSGLLRKTLNNTSKDLVSVNEDIEMLKLYLELEKLRTRGQINYQINIDDAIDVFATKIPPLIIQPYVENAIWHGILPSKNEGTVVISLSLDKDANTLLCKIKDNGIGYFTSKNNKQMTHESKGIKITEQRLGVSDAVKIIELKEGGTLVTIVIPMSL